MALERHVAAVQPPTLWGRRAGGRSWGGVCAPRPAQQRLSLGVWVCVFQGGGGSAWPGPRPASALGEGEATAAPPRLTFEGGLDEAEVERALLVAVAHALPEAVALQDALLEAHHVGVAAAQAGQGPELGQRQLHVLGRVAADALDGQAGAAAAGHGLVDHPVGAAPDLRHEAVARRRGGRLPRAAAASSDLHGGRGGSPQQRRHPLGAPQAPLRHPLCPSAAAVASRFHGTVAVGPSGCGCSCGLWRGASLFIPPGRSGTGLDGSLQQQQRPPPPSLAPGREPSCGSRERRKWQWLRQKVGVWGEADYGRRIEKGRPACPFKKRPPMAARVLKAAGMGCTTL